jgi:hypothetical protein
MLRKIFLLSLILNGVVGFSWIYNKMARDENSRIVGGREVEITDAPVSIMIKYLSNFT